MPLFAFLFLRNLSGFKVNLMFFRSEKVSEKTNSKLPPAGPLWHYHPPGRCGVPST
jgi:hypothetical protein